MHVSPPATGARPSTSISTADNVLLFVTTHLTRGYGGRVSFNRKLNPP